MMVFCETYSNFINRPANVRTRLAKAFLNINS